MHTTSLETRCVASAADFGQNIHVGTRRFWM